MSDKTFTPLPGRGLIKISGPDARAYLQGLVSQDMNRVHASQAVYGAFLSPQGKFQYDFFAFDLDGAVVLDCAADQLAGFLKKLTLYKLRSAVELSDISADFDVFSILDNLDFTDRGQARALDGGVLFADPRVLEMGCRAVLPNASAAVLPALGLVAGDLVAGDLVAYEQRRLRLGLGDGWRDMTPNKALLLENGFEELAGVDFDKGCFMGQELTARTRYRGLVKKRLLPVTIDGPAPPPGTDLIVDARNAGEMKSSSGNLGLALVRLDKLTDTVTFSCGDATLTPHIPAWVRFQNQGPAQDPAQDPTET